ncbi:MAG: hypothetical protein EA393_01810 [Bacteroidetes bacterium]|nr:MAG: hypothetical protein EA393_01810 [Bacteroidota bacterium]
MNPLFKKLNYKGQKEIFALNAPTSFEKELNEMQDYAAIRKDINKTKEIEFAIAFVTLQQEIDQLAKTIAPLIKGDAIIWFCYPKTSSKKYKCDFNRDTGWSVMGKLNMEGVRQVAIDEDWSALRFRKVEYIKKITRSESTILSKEGKKRTSGKGL